MLAKKALVLFMMIALVFAVAGCGGSEEPPMTDPSVDDTAPPPAPPEEPMVEDVDPEPQEMQRAMLNDVFFEFDQYRLSAESKSILEANANELRRDNDARIVIEGHCDERGTKSYNIALGQKRADAARDYLITLGVGGSRIESVSMGKEKPFATGSNEAAWAKNRRAHFILK